MPMDLWRWIKFAAGAIGRYVRRVVFRRPVELNVGRRIADLLDDNKLRSAVGMLGMGRDRSTGRIELRETDDEPVITWDIDESRLHYDRVRGEMERIADAMGGEFMDNPLTWIDKIIAVHPLGGCCMGETAEQGVVAPTGEVHGHPGLYVVDASVMPTSVGPNPSLTITAVAEHMAERFPV
jgi:cholesterol oxidase